LKGRPTDNILKKRKNRKFPFRYEKLDLSGKVKMDTLREILFWEFGYDRGCTARDLYEKTLLGVGAKVSEWRYISMRLLRYYRMGLLKRKKYFGEYQYTLSEKGENRLIYFWKRFDLLEPPSDWIYRGEIGELENKLAQDRKWLLSEIKKRQLKRLRDKLYRSII
jgi:hypothetical protein